MAEPLNARDPLDGANVMDLLRFWKTHTRELYTTRKGKPFFFIMSTHLGPIPVIINEQYLDSVLEIIERQLKQPRPRVETKTERCPVCFGWHEKDWRLVHSKEKSAPEESTIFRKPEWIGDYLGYSSGSPTRANCL